MNFKFDLVIVDEASQSESYTALSIAARAHSMIVIGDEKQTCAKSELSEEGKNALKTSIEKLQIAALKLLMPGEGHSLFRITQVSFPQQMEMLKDHFRYVIPTGAVTTITARSHFVN